MQFITDNLTLVLTLAFGGVVAAIVGAVLKYYFDRRLKRSEKASIPATPTSAAPSQTATAGSHSKVAQVGRDITIGRGKS